MLLDQNGQPLEAEARNEINAFFAREPLEAVMKPSLFIPSLAAQVRQAARDCVKWPEAEKQETLSFVLVGKLHAA